MAADTMWSAPQHRPPSPSISDFGGFTEYFDSFHQRGFVDQDNSFRRHIERQLESVCKKCGDCEAFCLCGGFLDPDYRESQQIAALSRRASNDFASTAKAMEGSSGTSTIAAKADPFTDDNHKLDNHGGAVTMQGPAHADDNVTSSTPPPLTQEPDQHDPTIALPNPLLGNDDNTMDNQNVTLPEALAAQMSLKETAQVDGHSSDVPNDPESVANNDGTWYPNTEPDTQDQTAFAKIVFPDGDLFVKTTTVVLGRNQERYRQHLRSKKQGQRAQEALDTYRKEPSQSSQPGDQPGASSESNPSLEGRPAPPSNFSERGGSVWYRTDDDGGWQLGKIRPRVSYRSKSSSTTSVAPASLHAGVNPDMLQDDESRMRRTVAFIPVHTENPEHINKISRHHLVFRYNFDEERWELEVLGNRAFVNEILFEKGTIVPLGHSDEIIIASLRMVFKLPDNIRHSPGLSRGTFSEVGGDVDASDEGSSDSGKERGPSTSPARRLSNAMQFGDSEPEDDDSDEDDEDEDELPEAPVRSSKRPTLKLKAQHGNKKKASALKLKQKLKLKQQEKQRRKSQKSPEKDSSSEEPAATNKKARKEPAKKPKTGGKTIPGAEAEAAKDARASPTAAAAENTAPVNEPPRRKGPGRPPKEGTVSKRDKSLAQKLIKEYTQRGEEPPDYPEAVEIVRQQQKDKARAAKLGQNGQVEPGQDVRPSIEVDGNGAGPSKPKKVVAADGEADGDENAEVIEANRLARAVSPVKPKEECTEEDLKKPDCTYLQLIDGILSEHPTGIADLQDIYERVMKKYPFFKYVIGGVGWQSSVRHNLLQNARFTSVGKSGKGKLWAIDYDCPIEKAPKRKKSPPKKDQMTNGHYPQAQHPQYSQSYGPPPQPNGQHAMGPGNYYSPYSQSGYPQYHQSGPPHGHPPWQPHPPPHPAQPQTPWNRLITEIIKFNTEHAMRYAGDREEQARQSKILEHFLNFLSDCYDSRAPEPASTARVRDSQNRGAFGAMAEIFRRHKPDIFIPDPWAQTQTVEEQFRSRRPPPPDDCAEIDRMMKERTTPLQQIRMSPSGSYQRVPQRSPVGSTTPPTFAPSDAQPYIPTAAQSPPRDRTPPAPYGGQVAPVSYPTAGTKRAADDDGVHSAQPEAKRTRSD